MNRDSSDEIRHHTEDPAEGDEPWEDTDVRAHSQYAAEGPDEPGQVRSRTEAGHALHQEDIQPETD